MNSVCVSSYILVGSNNSIKIFKNLCQVTELFFYKLFIYIDAEQKKAMHKKPRGSNLMYNLLSVGFKKSFEQHTFESEFVFLARIELHIDIIS